MKHEAAIEAITSTIDRVKRLYVTWSKQRGENYYKASVLYLLHAYGIDCQRDMAEHCGLPKQTINNVVVNLEKEGLVTLVVDEGDKRSKRVRLTEAGRVYARDMVEPLIACEERTLERMGEQKAEMLVDLLDEYAMFLEKEMSRHR